VFLGSGFLHDELLFLLWAFVAAVGLICFLFAMFPRAARPKRTRYRMIGASLAVIGMLLATPYAPAVLVDLRELLTTPPKAKATILAQDQTIDRIPFLAGTTVAIMPDGTVQSAELKSPLTFKGLTVTGHVEFAESGIVADATDTYITTGTLASSQEIPESDGVWCSPNRPFVMRFNPYSLDECELAQALKRPAIEIPARSHVKRGNRWTVDLPPGASPSSIGGIAVPGGWQVFLGSNPDLALAALSSPYPTVPGVQPWVEIQGLQLTGYIDFRAEGTRMGGELWQPATVEGVPHKRGDKVEFPILPRNAAPSEPHL
jgi:hypothetical protein